MAQLITTLGPKRADELGLILAHEHVFVDLRTWDQPGYAQAETSDVVELMAPEIARAQAAGVTALVECSTVGIGRRPDILKAVSEVTGLPLLVPTGSERFGYVPNVVYSCGGMIHAGKLILPYAMSDLATSIAVIDLQELLDSLTS